MIRSGRSELGLLGLSFMIALALWLNVSLNREGTLAEKRLVNVPVIVTGAEDNVQYVLRPSEVDITLQGAPNALSRAHAEEIQIQVNVNGLKEGRYSLYPRYRMNDPSGPHISRIYPEKIEVTVRRTDHRP